MYGIFTYIYHKKQPNVCICICTYVYNLCKYNIHIYLNIYILYYIDSVRLTSIIYSSIIIIIYIHIIHQHSHTIYFYHKNNKKTHHVNAVLATFKVVGTPWDYPPGVMCPAWSCNTLRWEVGMLHFTFFPWRIPMGRIGIFYLRIYHKNQPNVRYIYHTIDGSYGYW